MKPHHFKLANAVVKEFGLTHRGELVKYHDTPARPTRQIGDARAAFCHIGRNLGASIRSVGGYIGLSNPGVINACNRAKSMLDCGDRDFTRHCEAVERLMSVGEEVVP